MVYRSRRCYREQRESPEAFDSGASLRSSLTTFAAVLALAAVVERLAPFSPARPGQSRRAGLKGAALRGNPADARTATSEASEDRSEARDRRERGLSRCLQALSCRTL
ncbi:hypothetical protein BRC67_04985 [Halobacteriales archaeon QH_3_68_24]|nr:MAG: hypothetical protein BRC60_10715 [Halobacteriales archaeon QH_1_68_42]PSP52368.1 MAG: hypothetical protein BRC67_04985 [Halobacteriales archaeon QH_3_68_24]PSP53911.1 MAG: hypothetical protein BRC74_02675 [Halobacteriales archaeon QH_7_68_42]PSP92950.1 MAG: hypothetical protein BRC78_02575 [Halobacteriales archaeon QH_8_68_33]